MLCAGVAHAQDSDKESFPELDDLDRALGELSESGDGADEKLPPSKELIRDIADLQTTLRQLQDVLDGKMLAITELEDENEKLRRALRVRYGRENSGLPPVPMPNRALVESVLNDPRVQEARSDLMRTEPEEETGVSSYTVVSEWGRSPEVAARLEGNVSSLVGMAVSVRTGMSEENLKSIGRHLRKTYAQYDNMNIEIFDDLEAAQQFADYGTIKGDRRVMSISKHRHSERDVILLYRNGHSIEVR